MEPTLSFSDADNTPADFDRQAEIRLQHMLDVLHAHPAFQGNPEAGGISGSWQNEVMHIDATAVTSGSAWQQEFKVQRTNSKGRYVEAVVGSTLSASGEQTTTYAVRRTEDGWTIEYPLGQGQTDPDNRQVRTWQTDPGAANQSLVPFAQFHMQTNSILAELQAGTSRLSSPNGQPPAA